MAPERLSRLRLALIAPPSRFNERKLEEQFVAEFRAVGQTFAIYGLSLGFILTALSMMLVRLGIVSFADELFNQLTRLLILLVLGTSIGTLTLAPKFAASHFNWVVGIGLAVGIWSIGTMSIWLAYFRPDQPGKLLVAFVVAAWIGYGFSRMSVMLLAPIMLVASALMYFAAVIAEPGVKYGVLMYLAIVNLVGWISCIQIERRERRLFLQANRLTELGKMLETQMNQIVLAGEEKQVILHGVAHDLRQPLLTLDLSLALLHATGFQGAATSYKVLRTCIDNLHAGIERLLKDPNASVEAMQLEDVDLVGVIDEVFALFHIQAKARCVTLSFRTIGSGRPTVRSNRNALVAILQNLVGNAVKFQRIDPSFDRAVLITLASIGESARIDVWDSGNGIAQDDLAQAFRPYWRGQAADLGPQDGLGLGLAVVSRLCGKMPRHQVELKSVLGKGTRVRLRIPISNLKK